MIEPQAPDAVVISLRPGGWPRLLPVLAPLLVAAGLLAWLAFRPLDVAVKPDPGDAWLDQLPTPAAYRDAVYRVATRHELPPGLDGRGAERERAWLWSARDWYAHHRGSELLVFWVRHEPPADELTWTGRRVQADRQAATYETVLLRERARAADRLAERERIAQATARYREIEHARRALPTVAWVALMLSAAFWGLQWLWLRHGALVPVRIRLSPAGVDLEGARIDRDDLIGVRLHGHRVVFETTEGHVATPSLADASGAVDALWRSGVGALIRGPGDRQLDARARRASVAWVAGLARRSEEP